MFPEIMHEGRFRNPSLRWCPLVTNLTGANLSDIADGKALQDPLSSGNSSASAFNSQVKFIVGFFKCQYHSASSVTQNLILAPVQFLFR